MAPASEPKGQPLSLRLAVALSVAMLAVLLVAGVAVNRIVSGSLQQELSAGERDRITLVAGTLADLDVTAPRVQRGVELVLRRMANAMHGRAELILADGSTLIDVGRLPPGATTERIEEPVPGGGSVLVMEVPQPDRAFLRIFNVTLLVAGMLAVAAMIGVALFLSARLTRPLRGVTSAARRLGQGELGARASGGPDRESAELADAFNVMAERVERSEMLRRRAASDMAHDLATPATVLESQLQAMLDGVVPADREQLERSRAAASALSGVIAQLGDLVDAESATLQRRPERAPLAGLLSAAEQALEPIYRERGVKLAIDPIPGEVDVLVDAAQVGRALRNVLTNAAQHAPRGSAVRIWVEALPTAALVRVADEGPGITAEDLPHIFERFYRADRARSGGASRAGSGIGLTIARELLAANGGSIEVEVGGAVGTTFRISLPRAR